MLKGLTLLFFSSSYGTTTRICRETEYVANTRIFGLLFYSDSTQTNEILLRLDLDIWTKKCRVEPLVRIRSEYLTKIDFQSH